LHGPVKPLKFGRRSKLGGLSLLRFVGKMSAFRHWENEENERTCLKGNIRRAYYGGICGLEAFIYHDFVPGFKVGYVFIYVLRTAGEIDVTKYMPPDYLIRPDHITHKQTLG
jgi:hypothetical protein